MQKQLCKSKMQCDLVQFACHQRTIAAKFGKDLRMTSVESFKVATEDATLNLADLPRVKAVCSATERFLNERVGNLDKGGKVASPRNSTIVLDPPRAGAGARGLSRPARPSSPHAPGTPPDAPPPAPASRCACRRWSTVRGCAQRPLGQDRGNGG